MPLELFKDPSLHLEILDDRLADDNGRGVVVEIRRAADGRPDLLALPH